MGESLRSMYGKKLTVPGMKEGIRQPLYDFGTYDSAASTQLKFFATPRGQSLKTFADTNMELAGSLPAGQKFVAQALEVHIFPGSNAAGYVRQAPVAYANALAAPNFANDVWALAASGWIEIKIGSKPYLQIAPLLMAPPKTGIGINSAASIGRRQAAAADAQDQVTMDYARIVGRPFILDPVLPLDAQRAFEVTLNWPSPVTLPSGFDARIGVVLDGLLFRE